MNPKIHSNIVYKIARVWKQLSINRWIDEEDIFYIYSGILLSHKNNKFCHLQHSNLEGIMLGEKSQKKTNAECYYLCVESKK